MEENLIIDDAQASISAAFDSVNLINQLVLEEKVEEKEKTVKRNVDHLEIMLEKDFFSEALTSSQSADIDAAIASGKAYLA